MSSSRGGHFNTLIGGRRIRVLALIDDFTCEALAIEPDFSFPAIAVIRVLNRVCGERGFPATLRSDNGPEFVSHAMLRWSAESNVRLHFIAPGKPTQNAKIESLNARIHDEFLNEHAFLTLADARREAALWQQHYNDVRPHGSLRLMTPAEFASKHLTTEPTHLPAA